MRAWPQRAVRSGIPVHRCSAGKDFWRRGRFGRPHCVREGSGSRRDSGFRAYLRPMPQAGADWSPACLCC